MNPLEPNKGTISADALNAILAKLLAVQTAIVNAINAITIPSAADASETVKGIAELATQIETDAGVLDDKIVTPLKLATASNVIHSLPNATETVKGIAELATQIETDAGTLDDKIITPLKIQGRTVLRRCTLQFIGLTFNPADSSTYFMCGQPNAPITTDANRFFKLQKACHIKKVYTNINIGFVGSVENSTLHIRVNHTTDTLLNTFPINNTVIKLNSANVDIAIPAETEFNLKLVTPAWASNPTGVIFSGIIEFEYD